jgi:hypothetical protein
MEEVQGETQVLVQYRAFDLDPQIKLELTTRVR